jgi:hypothetical protein
MDADQDPDPAVFVIDLPKMPTKNQFKKKRIFGLLLFEGTCTSFSRKKVKKKSQSSRNQGFSYFI